MTFVDTNYFLRFLLNDVPEQHRSATQLFETAAKGEVELFTSALVFFELYWVFTSFYQKDKLEISKILSDVLQMKFIRFEHEDVLVQAIDIYQKTNFDLEDTFNLVYARLHHAKEFKTFDQKLNKQFLTSP